MAKRHKKSQFPHRGQASWERDKPAEAYDPVSVQANRQRDKVNGLTEGPPELAEFLNDDLRRQLVALKATMVAEQEQKEQRVRQALLGNTTSDAAFNRAGSAGSGKSRGTSAQVEQQKDEEVSFAEMLNPDIEDETTFANLLASSKLDWRTFKDQDFTGEPRGNKS